MSLVAFVILGLAACSPDPQAIVQEDVSYLRRAIIENYPYLDVHLRRDHFDWVQQFETLLKNEPVRFSGANQLEYLSQFLAGLNGHVRILGPEEYADFSKTIIPITASYPEYGVWGEVLARPKVQKAYRVLSDQRTAEEASPTTSLSVVATPPGFAKKARAGLLYLKVPTFRGELAEVEGPSLVRWLKVNSKSTSTIVFDVRGNGGGSDLFWMKYLVGPLISSTMTHETTVLYRGGALSQPFLRAKQTGLQPAIGFPLFTSLSHESDRVEPTGDNIPHGPVIVLMDHGCFSATEGFVAFCRATGFATTVGTNSGGDGVGFDPILVELPATHLVLTIPICGGLNPDGKLNYEEGTRPDIVLDPGDDALEYVSSHREQW